MPSLPRALLQGTTSEPPTDTLTRKMDSMSHARGSDAQASRRPHRPVTHRLPHVITYHRLPRIAWFEQAHSFDENLQLCAVQIDRSLLAPRRRVAVLLPHHPVTCRDNRRATLSLACHHQRARDAAHGQVTGASPSKSCRCKMCFQRACQNAYRNHATTTMLVRSLSRHTRAGDVAQHSVEAQTVQRWPPA